jgi:hypothetical protein
VPLSSHLDMAASRLLPERVNKLVSRGKHKHRIVCIEALGL